MQPHLSRHKCVRGSTLIEVAASLGFVVLAISSILAVLYFSFTKVWAKNALYAGLICEAQKKPNEKCQKLVRKRMSFLPFGTIKNLELSPTGHGQMTFQVKSILRSVDSKLDFHFRQKLPEGLP